MRIYDRILTVNGKVLDLKQSLWNQSKVKHIYVISCDHRGPLVFWNTFPFTKGISVIHFIEA